jgi:asparagine synthase (glutamine-hydrolysing)
MCGINGIFAYHAAAIAPTEVELLATREKMHARGPDGAGVWWSQNRRCAFGHRRLSVIDLSDLALQPMVSADGRLAVVFNGEIYNYRELRRGLADAGVAMRTNSDTEILLHLYARDGAQMVEHLRGMFAFAIWDARLGGLFLARDPYGIKPLYCANDGGTFRFASQVKALLAGGGVSRDLEPAGVVGFHLFGHVPEPFTLYNQIHSLPAGHTQWVDGLGPHEPKPYVQLAQILTRAAQNPVPLAELGAHVRASCRDSVRAHLIADVEIGVFLSGGVDSGALLGMIRDAGQHDIRAITLSFEEFQRTPEDEAPRAAEIAALYGAQHIVRTVNQREFETDLPAILEAMDQPSIDGINTWFVSKAAREVGLKVAISGLGGDELLAGYPSFTDLPRWHRRFGPLASVPGLGRLARSMMSAFLPGLLRAQPKAAGMLEYANSWAGTYLLRRGLFLPHELPQFMDEELVREGLQRLLPLHRIAEGMTPDPGSAMARVCGLESTNYLRNQLLRDSDWAGMAHSLEIRMPLVDITLFRSLAHLIGGLVPGAGKAALALAPSQPLPEFVLGRAKTGFVVPIGAWMAGVANDHDGAAKAMTSNGLVSRKLSRAVFSALASGSSCTSALRPHDPTLSLDASVL